MAEKIARIQCMVETEIRQTTNTFQISKETNELSNISEQFMDKYQEFFNDAKQEMYTRVQSLD